MNVLQLPKLRAGWKRWPLRLALLALALGVCGFLLAASGIIPIKASSGHWAITEWFLQFSKTRSIATHTIGVKVPSLNEPWKILKGAGHFETACAPCHGSPAQPQPRVAEYMLPPPPGLTNIIGKRDAAELFYIVKHGIKFTGMPAWPAPHRDDEVWAVVAFLREMPKLDAAAYHELAVGPGRQAEGAPIENLQPPREAPRAVTQSCARCHGEDGLGRGTGAFPVIAGQRREYLRASLHAYARHGRHSGIMGAVAAGLSDKAIDELAAYYAGLPPGRARSRSPDAGAITRGQKIAFHGIPQSRVPPCIECHGPREGPRNPHYPILAGQHAEYLTLQLELFSKHHRGGTKYAHLMHFVAGHLTPEQMRDVAAYFASLVPNDQPAPGLPSR
jgi:cytochrome c553